MAVKWERVKGTPMALDGDRVVSFAMKQMNPDLVAAYPITPQTEIVQQFSEYFANGEVDTNFVPVESEHAAMSTCVAAAAAGGRAQTATAGTGLALMWEMLWIAGGNRLPIVMHVVNRCLSVPLNILCDHADSMGCRDTGWIQLYDENCQEIYDNAIQCVRIAEHPDVMTPIMHCLDGFILGHGVERFDILPDEMVRRFIGTYKPKYSLLDVDHPTTYGPMDYHDYFPEHRRQQAAGMEKALEVIPQIGQEYGELTGRYYGLIDGYWLDDAEFVTVIMGSAAGTVRIVVDQLRDQGIKAGMLKIRCFRPFPVAAIVEALKDKKAIAVMDRCLAPGAEANPVFTEVCTHLFTHGFAPKVVNYVYGLGGRDTIPAQIHQIYQDLMTMEKTGVVGPTHRYLGIRE